MSDTGWILRDGDRDLVRLEDSVERDGGWFEYRVVPLGIEDLHQHLADDPSAVARLIAVDAATDERGPQLELDRSGPITPGRVRVKGLGPTKKKSRGLWAVVYEWMSRV